MVFLVYINVLDVDYDGLSELASSFVNAINPALNVFTPLLAHIPFIVSLIVGLFLGFTRD